MLLFDSLVRIYLMESITIIPLHPPTYVIEIKSSDTIEKLHKMIEEQVNIDVSRQKLIHYGNHLGDYRKTLSFYNIQDGDDIYLIECQVSSFTKY